MMSLYVMTKTALVTYKRPHRYQFSTFLTEARLVKNFSANNKEKKYKIKTWIFSLLYVRLFVVFYTFCS